MFVLSIWTISGRIGARSRPAARSRRRIGLAWLRRNVSAARRAVALSPADFIDDSVLWLTERGDDTRKDFVELDLRLVADQRADPGDVRYAARHVFEAGFVRLVVRDCHDRGRTARHLLDAAGEIADGDLLAVADVEDLADGPGLVDQGYHSLHNVPDVGEAARLGAVAEHRDRLAGERLTDEVRHHHPVLTRLARTDGVEETDDDDGEPALLPVCEREEFVDHLAAGVRPAVLRRRPEHEIGVFRKGDRRALAVHLRRRRDQDQLLLLARVLQHDFGAVDVGFDRADRRLDDQLDADR